MAMAMAMVLLLAMRPVMDLSCIDMYVLSSILHIWRLITFGAVGCTEVASLPYYAFFTKCKKARCVDFTSVRLCAYVVSVISNLTLARS
jgi:hypothetical protein